MQFLWKIFCILSIIIISLIIAELTFDFQNNNNVINLPPLGSVVEEDVTYILYATKRSSSEDDKENADKLQNENDGAGVLDAEKSNDERHNKDKLRSDMFDSTVNLKREEIEDSVERTGHFQNKAGNMATVIQNITSDNINILNNSTENLKKTDKMNCPDVPPNLVGAIKANKTIIDKQELEDKFESLLLDGGTFIPSCKAREWVAIIVPFRNREEQLLMFLNNIHPILMKQQVQYTIYVVEQTQEKVFNKGTLLNVAALEALKDRKFDCYIFHDVDLLPETDNNLYRCPESPRHMSVAVDIFNYELPYGALVGGVYAISPDQFKQLNGYSNLYWGWGGEDDDMYHRIKHQKFKILRESKDIARYTMIKHKQEIPNKNRTTLLRDSQQRIDNDGLNSIHIELMEKRQFSLYTWLLVDPLEEPTFKE